MNQYIYESELFALAKTELSRLPEWHGSTEITLDTKLTINEASYIFYTLTKTFYVERKYFSEAFQKKYNTIMKHSFYNSTQIPTLRKTIHVFESMNRKSLTKTYYLLEPYSQYHVQEKTKTEKTVMNEREMINFINKHCSDSIIIHNDQIR